MSKKDETFTQTEHALKELKKAEKESAATVVGGYSRGNTNIFGRKNIFIGLLLIVLTASITWSLTAEEHWLFSGSTLQKESTTFVEQVQELATLATAEAHIKVVLEETDNKLFGKDIALNLPGTKREVFLIVPAKVLAGVNLKEVTAEDLKVNEDKKTLDITLPHATLIQDPAIQMESVQVFSDEGLFRGEVKWDEGFDLAAEAQEKIKEEAIEIGLLEKAEKSAEKVLKSVFSNIDYTVNVTFK